MDGVPVLGTVEQMLSIAERQNATEVIIAMPSAPSEFVRALVRRAEDIGLRARAVGDVGRLLANGDNHRPGTINLRELSTETVVDWPPENRPSTRGARRVLVTGGAGFIGSHLTRMLLDRSYNVRVLDNFTYGYAGLSAIRNHPRLEIVAGDICNLRDVSRAMRDVDGVIGLAAIVGDPACNLDPEETINLNYAATKILAECADFYRVQRLVFASSCSVYGASLKEDDLLNERSRLNPVSLYARTRVLSESIIFDRCGDTEPVVLRLATVFGLSPRMRFDLVVNTLTARAVVDRTIAIFGGRQWRPNVHCRDAARAFLTALEAPGDKVAGEVFNVGGDENNHRISEIGDIVASVVGEVAVSLQNEIPDPRDYRVSFEKIRRVLNFVPEYAVRDGVREVASAMRADLNLRTHMDPMFHNVQALRQAMAREIPADVRATA
jgi:nucleoside-diphosphate-sugar epimerase